MKIIFLAVSLLIVTHAVNASSQATPNCHATYYQTKDLPCIDSFLEAIRHNQKQVNPNATGFFAGLFKHYPDTKDEIIKKAISPIEKAMFVESLFRSGHKEKAKEYASAHQLGGLVKNLRLMSTREIDKIYPFIDPADNDLLIGAFMATGENSYIELILNGTTKIDPSMLRDAYRVVLMMSKFGNNFTPEERQQGGSNALCEKYECKKNPKDFLHILTLSSGLWALKSLSLKNEDIRKSYKSFLETNQGIETILKSESTYFSNYLTMLLLKRAKVEGKTSENFLVAYETFKAPEELNKATSDFFEQKAAQQ